LRLCLVDSLTIKFALKRKAPQKSDKSDSPWLQFLRFHFLNWQGYGLFIWAFHQEDVPRFWKKTEVALFASEYVLFVLDLFSVASWADER
jgi:hypothetical protein